MISGSINHTLPFRNIYIYAPRISSFGNFVRRMCCARIPIYLSEGTSGKYTPQAPSCISAQHITLNRMGKHKFSKDVWSNIRKHIPQKNQERGHNIHVGLNGAITTVITQQSKWHPSKLYMEDYHLPFHYTGGKVAMSAVIVELGNRATIIRLLQRNLQAAQARMKSIADAHRWDIKFNKGDLVMVELWPSQSRWDQIKS